jgi:hypothetical protein
VGTFAPAPLKDSMKREQRGDIHVSVVRLSVERGRGTPGHACDGVQESVQAEPRGDWFHRRTQGRVAYLQSVQRARYVVRLTLQRWIN